MAIIIQEEKKSFNWLPFVIISVFLFVAVIGAYLLFFTEAPLIEKIAPSSQKTVSDISNINSSDFKNDLNSAKTQLQTKVNQAIPNSTVSPSMTPGRSNPFLSF
jgi:uncharacterized membrane protein SpoIIM required for sporulation